VLFRSESLEENDFYSDLSNGLAKNISKIYFRDKTPGWKVFSLSIHFNIKMMDKIDMDTVNFRNKEKGGGWKNSYIVVKKENICILTESLYENTFFRGFLNNIYLRISCYNCPSRSLKSGSDITIADYWGIENILPEFDDDKGVSLVMINTEKGRKFFGKDSVEDKFVIETDYASALISNPHIEKSPVLPGKRSRFFAKWHKGSIISLINGLTKKPLSLKIKQVFVAISKFILGNDNYIALRDNIKGILKRK
jgi:hypothetical protein